MTTYSHILGPVPGRAVCGASLGIAPLAGHVGAGETCPNCRAHNARMELAESTADINTERTT